jgi:uncharacterized protein (DUF488 family)
MRIFTLGFAKKSAREFFGILKLAGIRRLIDIRANNRSQLAAFTKRYDLEYFLQEIGGIGYAHRLDLAPTQDLLGRYRAKALGWDAYEVEFKRLLAQRGVLRSFDMAALAQATVLLCSEPTPEHCHRRLIVEGLKALHPGLVVTHL